MKVLVTGATGFIGSHLVEALWRKKQDIRCLVRNEHKASPLKKIGIEICIGDLQNVNSLNKALENIDVVYHLAAETQNAPEKLFYKVNLEGTENLLKACVENKVKKFIFYSSGAVYEEVRKFPLTENTPCNPKSAYAKSKLKAEEVVLKFHKEKMLPVVIIRPPAVYGPRDHPRQATSLIFNLVRKGFFLYIGDGSNLKEFCYVKNLVEGTILAAENPNSSGKTYLISDVRPYLLREIVETIAEEAGKRLIALRVPYIIPYIGAVSWEVLAKIFRFPPPVSRETLYKLGGNFYYNISLAKKELGYKPKYSLRDGIRETLQWREKVKMLRSSSR